MSTGPLLAIKDTLYETEEKAEKALRRGKWSENRNGWSRIVNKNNDDSVVEVAHIVRFEGRFRISTELISKSDFLSWS